MTATRAHTKEMKGRAKERESWTVEVVRSYIKCVSWWFFPCASNEW